MKEAHISDILDLHLQDYPDRKYIIYEGVKNVYLWVKVDAACRDVLHGIYHSCLVRKVNSNGVLEDFNDIYMIMKQNNWNVDDVVVGEHNRLKF